VTQNKDLSQYIFFNPFFQLLKKNINAYQSAVPKDSTILRHTNTEVQFENRFT
jgi:hypothetical protein